MTNTKITDYTRTADWWRYVEERDDRVLIDTSDSPDDQSEEHIFRKVVLCHQLYKYGYDVRTEVRGGDRRFDIYAANHPEIDNVLALEVGDLNTTPENMINYLKEVAEFVDGWMWWPYDIATRTRYLLEGYIHRMRQLPANRNPIDYLTRAPLGLENYISVTYIYLRGAFG